MKFDKDELKNNLTITQMEEILTELGAEPIVKNDHIECKTICHNGDSHKCWWWFNTKLFTCFTNCGTFDIFELIIKTRALKGEDWSLYNAMSFVADFFSINFEEDFSELRSELQDWNYFNKRSKGKLSLVYENQSVLPNFDNNILLHFPRPHIIPWEREGISKEVCDKRGICYDPISDGVVIPHFDIMGHLVGIGSNISSFQIQLLLSLGIQEIIIALDRQYQQIAGEEHKEWVKKLYALHKKYGKFVQLSYIFDKDYILKYKNSPIDQGKDIFLELYNKRIFI